MNFSQRWTDNLPIGGVITVALMWCAWVHHPRLLLENWISEFMRITRIVAFQSSCILFSKMENALDTSHPGTGNYNLNYTFWNRIIYWKVRWVNFKDMKYLIITNTLLEINNQKFSYVGKDIFQILSPLLKWSSKIRAMELYNVHKIHCFFLQWFCIYSLWKFSWILSS